jgi:hypothetical protein
MPPYAGGPPPYPTGGYPAAYPTAPPHPAPASGPGRGLVIGLVAAVVVAGIIGTAVLLVLLRPSTSTVQPERPPVTLRSPETATNSVTSTPVTPPSVAVAPSTTLPAATAATVPEARPSATPPPRRSVSPAATPAQVAERLPTPAIAPPTPVPAVAEPVPPAPAAPSFPGAGKVELGEKFYEKTLAFEEGQPLAFEGHVGPLKADKVQFSVGEKKGRFGKVDELKTEMRAVIPVLDCPKGAGEWDYKLIVQLLDENGRPLDKLEGGGSCENEIKTIAATRGVLKALIPSIRGVKIRFEAAKD